MMLRLVRYGSLALATVISGAAFLETSGPAAAQGGIVCEFGSTKYRRCCRQSYGRNPGIGARARADDIEACMDRGPSGQKAASGKKKQKTPPTADDE
jgi:hypothetical protein